MNSFVRIRGREPQVCEFPQCVNALKVMIIQSGGESYLICFKYWTERLGVCPKNCRNCRGHWTNCQDQTGKIVEQSRLL